MEKDPLRRREIYEKAKRFEEQVADLFRLQGFRALIDYKRDDMQFDIRLETSFGALPIHVLVECKDTDDSVTQRDIREFATKVDYVTREDKLQYQAILVARSGFANNAHEAAKNLRINLQTYEQLLFSLVDLRPNLDDAVRKFQGTALERLYVEQGVVFEGEIRRGKTVKSRPLIEAVLRWLTDTSGTFLALLGDFGCGKTSFSKRLACELALKAREELADGRATTRVPILIDLREGGSTTVTLESLLTQHFQRLAPSQPFNPQALFQLNREGHLLIIFDGFDETIAYTEPGRYVENLRQLLRAAEGKAKVLLTCRTHYFRDRPEALRRLGKAPEMVSAEGATRLYEEIQERPGAEIGYLLEFREEQIAEYLRKALPPPADWHAFREQIRRTYNLNELAERPFLLEIIVKTLPHLSERQGEVTLAGLYEVYCASWFDHTDFRLTLTREKKVALVEYLARLVWDSPENRVHYDLLFEKSTDFFKDRPLTLHDKERIDYEVRTALFLHRDAEGRYSFIHRSFLEFFIARSIRTGLAKGDASCLALKRVTREVAFFLEFWPEAKQIPEVAGAALAASYHPETSENALLLLYFHARATLGPLAGPGVEKEDPAGIRDAFRAIRPKILRLDGSDLSAARLPGIDLTGANLERAILIRADLREATLDRAQLAGALLGGADLRRASAQETDLSEADLYHADAQEASFQGANLHRANLSFARLTRAGFSGADLSEIQSMGAGFLNVTPQLEIPLAITAGRPLPESLTFRIQIGHSSAIRSVAWNPEGTVLATASDDRTIKLWDASSGRLLNTLVGHENYVLTVAWSPDGQHLASGSYDKSVRLWEASSGRLLNTLEGHENYVFSVAWSPDGQRLASGSRDQTVRLWDTLSGRLLKTLAGHENYVLSVAWSPDGQRLASGSRDQTVRLWDASSGWRLNTLTGHKDWIQSVVWSPDGQHLASGSRDRTVRLWNALSGRHVNTLAGQEHPISTVAWSPDGQRLASGSDDRRVRLWDASTGRLLNTLASDSSVITVAWSPDGQGLASGSDGRSVRLWDASSGRLLNTLAGHENYALVVAWSPDGQHLASGSRDQAVRLWDASSGRLLNTLASGSSVLSMAWSPDGQRLASGSYDNSVRLWDALSGRLLNTLEGHEKYVFSVAWSPDGQRLASGSDDRSVRLWDVSTGRLRKILSSDSSVLTVAWSPDGQRLAAGSYDNSVRLWDASSGRLLNTLYSGGSILAVAWSPDGQRLASGSRDQTVRLWDASSGRLLNTLTSDGSVFTVAWSPDGQRLASGSDDRSVRLWDASTGQLVKSLASDSSVLTVAWSPDGQRLLLSSSRSLLEFWDVRSEPSRLLCRLYQTPNGSGFAFTPDGYVSGPPEALEFVRFGDNWALYDITDVPERFSPERVAAALGPSSSGTTPQPED
ncbi:MAG TPA: pentapeptide repeat-containing protein [Thermoanaerobaculia bacterium]|nr:pentapeptide repeat-containing protein [Thermoanaerobaculia bacterium]